ncbi:tagaturonate reductase [Bilifractor porci]|uniref:Tagaturonate reductase n=1 Tax=Bilifractor porci TaxID=2606636 RepID=A0A7X2P9E9_9FIRM|nr:tagaturonate reductase [Bilifractor porci]MST82221.1 tagaturonate reductase [Bilifractor porci]
MEKLSYKTLRMLGYKGYLLEKAPEKILQFGEGNFLRAFVDYWFDMANEKAGFNGKAVLIQPIRTGLTEQINTQQGLYTLYLRGSEKGRRIDDKRVISSVSRCLNPYDTEDFDKMMEVAASDDLQYIVSNTTEAGIVYDPSCRREDRPASSFPGKVTQILLHRFEAGKEPLIILSCELIDNNGKELKKCVEQYIDHWKLSDAFHNWCEKCTFCSTLVDRIVPGRVHDPKTKSEMDRANGYEDDLIDVGECFGVWIIEGSSGLENVLPFKKAGLNVQVVSDVTPYKQRKVRILNGAHTGFALGAYLAGFNIVRDCMHDETIKGFMNKMLFDEVIPTLPLEQQDLEAFAAAVEDRFNNPFINHELLSISLNSTSKWRARNMPSFLEYTEKKNKLPTCLTMSLAAYIAFYSNDIQERSEKGLSCRRDDGIIYIVSDDAWILDFYNEHKNSTEEELVHAVLCNVKMWGRNLTDVPDLEQTVTMYLKKIHEDGAKEAFAFCL